MISSEKQLSDYTLNPPDNRVIHVQIPLISAGERMDAALASLLTDYSRSRIQTCIRDQGVRVDGKLANAKDRLRGGEQIELEIEPHPSEIKAEPEIMALDIVYEDDSLLIINKPAGLVVHPGSGNWQGTLMNGLLHHAPQLTHIPRAGIVHRLDKDTSGLMVVAKTLTAQTHLVRQLQARTVKREYLAVTEGLVMQGGRIEAPIGRHPVQRTLMAVHPQGREAVTHYVVLERFERHTLLRCALETGRTHQIRVHMQHIGHPLIGDPTYNRRNKQILPGGLPFLRQALHAAKLGLLHPESGELMQWQHEPPADFLLLLEALKATRKP
jgi:23S rRNA pseudouridine1911/1915/1917 synthase